MKFPHTTLKTILNVLIIKTEQQFQHKNICVYFIIKKLIIYYVI